MNFFENIEAWYKQIRDQQPRWLALTLDGAVCVVVASALLLSFFLLSSMFPGNRISSNGVP